MIVLMILAFILKLALLIVLVPVIAVNKIVVGFCTLILMVAGGILNLIACLLGGVSLIVLFFNWAGRLNPMPQIFSAVVPVLVMAFLISPFGLPAVAGLVIALFNGITDGMMALYNRDFLLGGFDY